MRTFIYKRTHSGDPDPTIGAFGSSDCMGSQRSRSFDAVIGVGGTSREPQRAGIARKLTWVGIGPHKIDIGLRGPLVNFDHFLYRGEEGPLLESLAPKLAIRMYGGQLRGGILHSAWVPGAEELDREVTAILDLATNAPPSG